MNYRSINDLNKTIINNLHLLPRDIDLIVGVPRSGLLAANILALYLNLPITDVEGLINGRIISSGDRYKRNNKKYIDSIDEVKKVLIIDDSSATGRSMDEVRELISKADLPFEILYGAVYVDPEMKQILDFSFEICERPRVFEWNIMHHSVLKNSCIDIDGVLCRDPKKEENDDGERYIKFINTCEPFFIPSVRVGYLVTSRLEKYRKETEAWLKKQNIEYEKLIMMDLPNKEARVKAGNHAQFKSNVYKKSDKQLFIESSLKQAIDIANLSHKQVFCVENGKMILPEGTAIKKKIILQRKVTTFKLRIKNKLKKTFIYPIYKFFKNIKNRYL